MRCLKKQFEDKKKVKIQHEFSPLCQSIADCNFEQFFKLIQPDQSVLSQKNLGEFTPLFFIARSLRQNISFFVKVWEVLDCPIKELLLPFVPLHITTMEIADFVENKLPEVLPFVPIPAPVPTHHQTLYPILSVANESSLPLQVFTWMEKNGAKMDVVNKYGNNVAHKVLARGNMEIGLCLKKNWPNLFSEKNSEGEIPDQFCKKK